MHSALRGLDALVHTQPAAAYGQATFATTPYQRADAAVCGGDPLPLK